MSKKCLCFICTVIENCGNVNVNHIYASYFASYTLRCTVMDDWGRVKLAFDLEVCAIPKMTFVGVCRKRVKGDTWHYKKLCEDILNTAKL